MRVPTGTLLRAGVAALVGVAVVTGCSGSDPEPGRIIPTATASTSVSTPSRSTPSTPEQQIEATMTEYMDAANKMFATGDVATIRAMSTAGCPCRKVTRYVEQVVSAGGQFRGASYEDVSIRVHDVGERDRPR